jgi:mannan endo-1,4-beta-mannosidase
MSLTDTTLLGVKFRQDPNPLWEKIDGVALGDTFNYKTINSTDIGKLLANEASDDNTVTIVYDWKGIGYIKNGFNLLDTADYKLINGYTTFIHKSKISQFNPILPPSIISDWMNNKSYNVGDSIIFSSTNYSCIKAHVSNLAWLPNKTTILWTPNSTTPNPGTSGFVSWNGSNFVCDGNKFVPVGVNCFGLGLCQEYMNYFSHKQITEIFDSVKKLSGTCIRSHTLGFSASSENSLLDYNLNFRDSAWDPIDFSLSEAKRTGIKVIPILSDPYEYYHGSYFAFCNGVPKDQFFTHPTPRSNFKKFISGWLNHVNKYTGIVNKNCPDIFALQLCNECGQQRPSSGSTAIPSKEWLTDISNHIKSIASNILVMCPTDESLGMSDEFNIKNLDVYSQHFYWNDFNRMNINYNNAKKVNKPYIIGEYSSQFGQDWFSYIEKLGVHGSFSWSLLPKHHDGNRLVHGDNFDFWYDNKTPENTRQLLLMSNHFRRMRGLNIVNQLTF